MTLKCGKFYFHDQKSKLLTEYKSVFNYDYELRPSIKIDDDIVIYF